MTFADKYLIISVIIALFDIWVAFNIFLSGRKWAPYLALTCLMAAVVDLSYLATILAHQYLYASIFSSMYFISIDIMLNSLAFFVWHYARSRPSPAVRSLFVLSMIYMGFDILSFLINPIYEISFHCVPRETAIAQFPFKMHLPGQLHLIYSYLIVVFVLAVLIWKALRVPSEYRRQYIYGLISILAIVAINAIFLYLPNAGLLSLLDVSVLAYSISVYLLYQCFYGYTRQGMQTLLKTSIFENIDLGIILFDYEDNMILHNASASKFLSNVTLTEGQPLDTFLDQCGISLNRELSAENYSMQCYIGDGTSEAIHPLRCDYRVLFDKHNATIGKLFIFTDAKMQTDLLTGFHNWDDFRDYHLENMENRNQSLVVVICDITGLALINSMEGRDSGDQAMKNLAELLRSHFRQDAYYIRGEEANIILLCQGMTEEAVINRMNLVCKEYNRGLEFATSTAAKDHLGIHDAIREADQALHTRKLINKESIHYHALTSLLRALQECDSDTEEHVRRTRMLGENLSARLKLSSVQVSKLSLLALLHDIGKIGVPLEILNKPGRLTDDEWTVIKSHVEKGYQIALSSPDLSPIAPEIRHHHERWDGNGYPDGLSRESIPLLSRIIAVVDAYDAMVMNRSYRSGRSSQAALEELRRCAGTQFDPYIVSSFIQMLQENPALAYSAATAGTVQSEADSGPLTSETSDPMNFNVHAVHYGRYFLDENMHIISIDPVFTELTGFTDDDIANEKLLQIDLIPPEDRTTYLCALNEQLAINKMAFFEHRILCKSGDIISVFCNGRIYYDSAARQNRSEILIFSCTDTNAARKLVEQERNKSKIRLEEWENTYRRDSLTGLLNRAPFASDVELLLLTGDYTLMMLMLDVDHFKEYNDQNGHKAGDDLLICLAQSLGTVVRSDDLVARMGGDEFSAVIKLPKGCSKETARNRAAGIFDKLEVLMKNSGYDGLITMGAALSGSETSSFVKLYEAADSSLYKGKKAGRNRLEFGASMTAE